MKEELINLLDKIQRETGLPIRREQITRRWLVWVKKPLGIKADFYSIKHSNLDDIAEIFDAETASKAARHKSKVVTLKNYLSGEDARAHERLKEVGNSFSKAK